MDQAKYSGVVLRPGVKEVNYFFAQQAGNESGMFAQIVKNSFLQGFILNPWRGIGQLSLLLGGEYLVGEIDVVFLEGVILLKDLGVVAGGEEAPRIGDDGNQVPGAVIII